MSEFDYSEFIKKTYKKESTDAKKMEYYECIKICNDLDQNKSVEENKSENIENGDTKNLKEILNYITSLITAFTALCAGFSMFFNASFAFNAGIFYKVPTYLFNDNIDFEFIIRLAIYILTTYVLLSPIILRDRRRSNKIDRFESFLLSLLLSAYVGFIFFVILINLLIKFNFKIDINYIYIISLIFWIFLWRLYHYIITDAPKLWIKSRNDILLCASIKKEVKDTKLPKGKFRIYIFYIVFIVVLVLCTAFFTFGGINLNPKNKMSYEILKDEKTYNVIIGYKDGMAITLTGVESVRSGDRRLKFINNEYKIQEVKNKVVVYKNFDKVIPYKNSGFISGSNG